MEKNHITGILQHGRQGLPGKPHISGLDGLRTLAIAGVTLFHMFPDKIPGGYLGVSLFFVLTGYLLAYTSAEEWAAGRFSVLKYYRKRICRIYPSLLVVLLTSIGVFHFLAPKAIEAVRPEVLSVVLGYNNWWQIAQNADYFTRLTNTSPFTHLWFMGIELQYYLLWPLLFFLYTVIFRFLGRNFALALLAVLAVASAGMMPLMYTPDMDVTRLYYGTDTRVYALLFGAVMGLYRSGRAVSSSRRSSWRILSYCVFGFLTGVTIAAYLLLDGQNGFTYQGGMLLMTVAFCILLGLTADSRLLLGELLELRAFRWIGRRSYGIFLWQYPVIYLFSHMGWTELPFYALLELLVILLLTVWSDALADCVTKGRLPFGESRLALVRGLCFFLVTFFGVVFMGYGCNGVAASAEYKAPDQAELQARLEENAADLAKQQEAAGNTQTTESSLQQVNLNGAVCIGDSVMLGSAKALQQALPGCYIDAEVSRYVGGGLEAAQAMQAQGRLGNIVVIALGTNGPIAGAERYEVQTRELLKYLGPDRHIFWVNVYCPELKWQNTNNDYIEKIAAEHSNVTVVDWNGLISQHPEWLVKDGIHPNDEGTVQYAKLIHDRMSQVLSEEKTMDS